MATSFQAAHAEPIADPIEWPRHGADGRRIGRAIAIIFGLGLASAVLVGLALSSVAIATLYAAMMAGAAAVGHAVSLGRSRGRVERRDWTLVRAALDSQSEAMAISDGAGALLCANSVYGARMGGFRSPVELDPAAAEQLLRLGGSALFVRGEGERADRLLMSAEVADPNGGEILWRVRSAAGDELRDRVTSLILGKLGDLLGSAGLLAAMTDRRGAIIASNDAFREATGRADGNLSDSVEIGLGQPRGIWLPDGEFRPMRVVELPLRPEGGEIESYLFLLSDEIRVVAPATQPDTIPELLGVLPLGLALADRDGRLMLMNLAFQSTAGVAESDSAIYPSDLVVDDDKSLVADTIHRAIAGRLKPQDLRVRLKFKPEEQIVLTVARAAQLGDAAVVLSLRDNREQLKLERQIAQATKMQAVGQLAGGVAHDFNNILTAVIGYCDLMLTRHLPGDADFDDVSQIRQNANRAANLVRQLLAFSRQQTLRPRVLQVSDVIGELSHLLKRLLGETITLSVRHGRNLDAVRVDPGQLEQVIVNLAVNARDAMPSGGALEISTYAVSSAEVRALGYDMMPAADYVAVDVADTGTGIPTEIIGNIFEPFFTTKEVGQGTGLGLSTVYGIVKQTGGFIFATRSGANGTTFTIFLPAHARVVERPAAEAPAASTEAVWGSGTVLVVEDEAMVRTVAERALVRRGYEVLSAASGEEALEILDSRPGGVDLLVSDVVMPLMDGPALGREARARQPALPIIFMSGYAEEQLRRSIDIPDTYFLPKPFSVQELTDAVRGALARDKAA